MPGSGSISSSSTFFDLSDAINAPYNAKTRLPASRKPRALLRTTATRPDREKPLLTWPLQQQSTSQSRQTPKTPSTKRARNKSAESLSEKNPPLGIPNPRARKQARRMSPCPNSSKAKQVPFMTLGNRRLSTPRRMSPPVIDLTISPSPGSPSEDPVLLVGTTTCTGKRKRDEEAGPSSPNPSVTDRPLQTFTPPPTKIPKQESISPAAIRSPRPETHSYPPHPVIQDENDSYEEIRSDPGDSEQRDAGVGYLDENYGFIGDVFEVPTQRGSPSPDTLYDRSFTKLGQRKPTPRRLVLEDEGDLSAMAKTMYYEHEEGQVEAPSPSPSSRRRNRVRAAADTAARGSPRPYIRILDGLDGDAQEQERRDDPQLSFDGADSDKSGYVHDPTGFEVLEEVPNDSQEGEEEPLGCEDGNEYRESQSIPLPPSSTPPFAIDQLGSRGSTKEEGDDDPWGKSLDERQPELEPTITMRFDPSQELPAGRTRFGRGLGERFRENQVPFSSSPIQSVSTQQDSPSTDRIQVEQSVAYESLEDDSTRNPFLLQFQRLDDGCADERVPPRSPEEGEYHPEPRHAGLSHVGARTEVPATVALEIPKIRIGDEDIGSQDGTEEERKYEESDSAIIEVSSLDPKAAARAAVILKMHHDYILEGGQESGRLGGSRSRQRASPRYSRSRSTSCYRSEDVANTSTIFLPELLQEAEEEVSNRSVTMSPRKRASFLPLVNLESSTIPMQRQKSEAASLPAQNLLSLPSGWCRDDWKNMERAFVRERKIIAQRNGLKSSSKVDPSSVNLDDVVDRFVTSNELSARSRVGPEFKRETLLLRAAALQRRLVKLVVNSRYATPTADLRSMIPETPSTFGDDFDYGRSSRQSSMRRSTSAQSLPPSLQASHYAHLHSEANASRSATAGSHSSSSSSSDPLLVTPTVREERATPSPSVTSRLLSYVGLGRGSAPPPHPSAVSGTVPDVFKVPWEPGSSSNPMVRGISPEMVQLRHSGPIPLPEPLRRASNAPIQNPSVRLSREYEEFPELRHVDPPSRPSTTSPPSKHLRSVSSSGSVKDLVKGFEYLTQEVEEKAMRSTPRPSRIPSLMNRCGDSRARSVSQFSVKSSSSADFTGSWGRNHPFDISADPDADNTFEHSQQRCDAHSAPFSIPSSASATAAMPLPKQKRIPTTAPPKKRLSLFSWL